MSFIAQLDCADLAPLDAEGTLPRDGMLYFFFEMPSFANNEGAVLYAPAGYPLAIAPRPHDLEEEYVYPAASIDKLSLGLSVPRRSDEAAPGLLKLKHDDELMQQYLESGFGMKREGILQLGGYPDFVQLGKSSPQTPLLLQMHAPEKLWPSYVFGDTGALYYFIDKTALKQRRFDKVLTLLQCC